MPSASRERNYLPPVVTKALPGATGGEYLSPVVCKTNWLHLVQPRESFLVGEASPGICDPWK